MSSMDFDIEVEKIESRPSLDKVNGNQEDGAATRGKVITQPLSCANGSGGSVAAAVKSDTPSSPSRKRIRLSLKGRPVATVSVVRSTEDHRPLVVERQTLPGSDTTGKQFKVEQGIESSNGEPTKSFAATEPTRNESATIVNSEDTFPSPPNKKIKVETEDIQGKPEGRVKDTSLTQEFKAVKTELDRNATDGTKSSEASPDAQDAMVLENGATGEDDAVAAVVEEPPKHEKSVKPKVAAPGPTKKGPTAVPQHSAVLGEKKRNAAALRSIRMPPMSSPGLLIPPGIYRGPTDANGLVSPNAVFTEAMETAGYNYATRSSDPHRGSSVQRVVDDMYDSDVKLCLNFPELIPRKYLQKQEDSTAISRSETASGSEQSSNEKPDEVHPAKIDQNAPPKPTLMLSVAERLMRIFSSNPAKSTHDSSNIQGNRPGKRSRVRLFSEMVPVSLSLPYPEEYIINRLEYVKLVNEREKTIVARQQEEENIEMQQKKCEALGEEYDGPTQPQIAVPPIPVPPDPPKLSELQGMNTDIYCNQDHPIYKPKEDFAEHLDSRCFHISEGRYFGLTSCGLADQHFVGPNAPGIGGLHLSSVSGLATSATSGAGNGVPVFNPPSTLAGPKVSVALGIVSAKTSVKSVPSKLGSVSHTKDDVNSKVLIPIASKGEPPQKSFGPAKNGPTVTGTRHHLKLIMENGGEEAENMRMVIIKAAVHAVRAGKSMDRSFRASDRRVYPDVGKAFSTHSGLKPCAKCKSNKQGTFHCRLRRKHTEPDYDGGDSWQILCPFFDTSLADLLIKPLKKKENSSENPDDAATS
ncbi:hypothetical protein IV203_037821 [Nitzschia inconspicua]|uniref:Uncharacterized protein n=1 Tax=Nitzschia inconspicua TaxID=303405 RepID=A0A9K3Q1B9_9STRA|nr:hypothetical protein IV203_037821 [Nitzschia inconspicua]